MLPRGLRRASSIPSRRPAPPSTPTRNTCASASPTTAASWKRCAPVEAHHPPLPRRASRCSTGSPPCPRTRGTGTIAARARTWPMGWPACPAPSCGGLDQWSTLKEGTVEGAKAEAQEAIARTGGRGLILGAGCVLLPETPDATMVKLITSVGGRLPTRPVPASALTCPARRWLRWLLVGARARRRRGRGAAPHPRRAGAGGSTPRPSSPPTRSLDGANKARRFFRHAGVDFGARGGHAGDRRRRRSRRPAHRLGARLRARRHPRASRVQALYRVPPPAGGASYGSVRRSRGGASSGASAPAAMPSACPTSTSSCARARAARTPMAISGHRGPDEDRAPACFDPKRSYSMGRLAAHLSHSLRRALP